MIISPNQSLCTDLLIVPLQDGLIDISWSVNTDSLKTLLESSIEKILNFQTLVDFDIEIDNVDTFDSINLISTKFSNIEKIYRGNVVFSAIIPFHKNKFEETNYFLRIKINNEIINYNVKINSIQSQEQISIMDTWSESKSFSISKNYTKDLIESMYSLVADFNSYNKEVKSANFYYLFQALATSLNEEFTDIINEKNKIFLNKALPDSLINTFGELFKFSDSYGLSMEEYRRIIKNLIIGYQHGGAWNYIKEVLKYLTGYTPELITFKNFYPWILRKAEVIGYETNGSPIYNWNRQDPINFLDRNYFNPESNYYLYESNFNISNMNKNRNLLLNSGEKLFTFIVKSDNFFNVNADKEKIKIILNLLKSTYTKYILNISNYEEIELFSRFIFIDDENKYLLGSDNYYIRY